MGEIAAIGTAVTWALFAIFVTSASRRIGSFTMSHYRMLFALVQLVIIQLIVAGDLFPGVTGQNWLLLAISGLGGYFLCDLCLFQCYVDIGPRVGILIFSFYPFVSAFLAYFFLGERLPALAWLGIVVTLAGIFWVVVEKKDKAYHLHTKHHRRGIILASLAVVFQGVSFTVAKPAMIGPDAVDPLTATLIRALFGGIAFWLVSLFRGKLKEVIQKGRDRKALLIIFGASIVGATVGVWLSMVAIQLAPVGIASTLMAMMPVAILPMVRVAYKEKISWRAIIGAIIACIGAAILFNT